MTMTCNHCSNEIRRGEEYIALLRQTEKVGRFGAVTVKDTDSSAYFHKACAPKRALFDAVIQVAQP